MSYYFLSLFVLYCFPILPWPTQDCVCVQILAPLGVSILIIKSVFPLYFVLFLPDVLIPSSLFNVYIFQGQ